MPATFVHDVQAVSKGRRSLVNLRATSGALDFTVVGIGASSGGLEACTRLVGALPATTGLAFILVQHLDPTHESMLVDLLAVHTPMPVRQATDGMRIERDHFYIIPPGADLVVEGDVLRLSKPPARHGARRPFDLLLKSLAVACGARSVCVILSGTGADGSVGLKAIKQECGLVIAQDPDEAAHDGMPRSAMMTGAVDLVLPAAGIPDALVTYDRRMALARHGASPNGPPTWLPEVLDLLRTRTAHDFALYKPGTLQRRIERRMAMAPVAADDMDGYLQILRSDAGELERVAKDLLINVTSFFRDPATFDLLAETIVSDLIRRRAPDQALRVWVAGCSTGEEAYSLAMLFREAMTAQNVAVKLQLFASDVDPEAVAIAREGLYPDAIGSDVSPARLARFFAREEGGYRVLPDLREAVLFTVQDVLADPPFSRLDMVSCRNLLIYLGPEAQAKVISVFHFALRQDGLLLLGGSETPGSTAGRFEVVSKAARLYRRIGRSRPAEIDFRTVAAETSRPNPVPGPQVPQRRAAYAELCRRLVVDTLAPAAVLVNRQHECLYALGATDRYLRVAPGYPTHDVLKMAPEDIRPKLRSAIARATQEQARIVLPGCRTPGKAGAPFFSLVVQPFSVDGEDLVLIGFVDEPPLERMREGPPDPQERPRIAELEAELEATRTELQGAIRTLEISGEEQRAVNEESLSVSEEFQSTNEELLISKEELQSLNEELTALNSQLQETLERQRTTSDDLQNVLYSTDVATLFLDVDLNIRFFTPATKALFNVIPSDIGRPLADLNSLAADALLTKDARTVLKRLAPLEREIEAERGVWFIRRVLPYRTGGRGVGGVVITFTDITERKRAAKALEAAKQEAEVANVAKSRFLAAASHDLRQPLQSLVLLQGLLTKVVEGAGPRKLLARLDQTLAAMSGMLNTLLDINQIEAGVVRAEVVDFAVRDLLLRMREAFADQAHAQDLDFRVVPCGATVRSDPALLEQMVRNLISNALKYTKRGKVLLGCRRRNGVLSIEVCDTGVGIPAEDLDTVFAEYHQLDNAARDRSRGLGLGLPIVRRLGRLLDHKISVRSRLGQGSVFAIDVPMPPARGDATPVHDRAPAVPAAGGAVRRTGVILVVEDDPELRGLIEALLHGEGHRAASAPDGPAALDMVERGTIRPDLVLVDYNLPGGMDGLDVAARLRTSLQARIPVIVLTGDISIRALREIAQQNCAQLSKPVRVEDLNRTIQERLSASVPTVRPRAEPLSGADRPDVVFIVDDDAGVRAAIRSVLEADDQAVEDFATCEAFLEAYRPGLKACLLIDAYLPGMSGLQLLQRLRRDGDRLPAIMITGNSDVAMAVQAMRAGASDFIEKPVGGRELLASIARASEQSRDANKLFAWRAAAARHMAGLTVRQRQVMDLVLAGHPSKNIAADLGISQRTVENHRASVMKKTGSGSLPALARLALAAASNDGPPQPAETILRGA